MNTSGSISQPLKTFIATRVSAIFNDRSRGETPVVRRTDGLFGPGAVAWRVHGDVASMMVGGVASLLLQMLHPAVLAGVWDHSNFRTDMSGRLRRTARFIALTTYSGRGEAQAAMARVRSIHDHVHGVLPDGTPYAANDPASLAWVHLTETTCFLNAWMRYAEPGMSRRDHDRYFAEMAQIGTALGAAPVPHSRLEAQRLIADMRHLLRADERTREVANLVLRPPAAKSPVPARPMVRMPDPLHLLTMQAGVDLLPEWARRLHRLPNPILGRPLVRIGTQGVAQTLRWAFR